MSQWRPQIVRDGIAECFEFFIRRFLFFFLLILKDKFFVGNDQFICPFFFFFVLKNKFFISND